jgi:hypothetical protein
MSKGAAPDRKIRDMVSTPVSPVANTTEMMAVQGDREPVVREEWWGHLEAGQTAFPPKVQLEHRSDTLQSCSTSHFQLRELTYHRVTKGFGGTS